jgi:hypothetical protein
VTTFHRSATPPEAEVYVNPVARVFPFGLKAIAVTLEGDWEESLSTVIGCLVARLQM